MTTTIGEVMTKDPVCMPADTSICDAARMMRDRDIGDVIIQDGNRLAGIVSLGDLAMERDSKSVLADISSAPPNN